MLGWPNSAAHSTACAFAAQRAACFAAVVTLLWGCEPRTEQTPPGSDVGLDQPPKPTPSGSALPSAAVNAAPEASAGSLADASADAGGGSAERGGDVVLLFGGDVNLGRGTGQRILREPGYQPLRFMKPYFDSADFRSVNLESQLSDQKGITQAKHSRLVFTGPPGGAEVLSGASIELVSLANNHAWDYGKSALIETFRNLERVKVQYVGASEQPGKRAYEHVSVTVRGLRLAVFGVTHIWNQGPINEHPGRLHVAWADFAELKPRIEAAKRDHDLVIMSYHGGAEYVEAPMTWTRDFVRAVMSAGVDVFIGHHPHVPQGVGWAGERPVFYSLGNLVFPMHSDHVWTGTSFLARLTLSQPEAGAKPKFVRVEACPYFILGHVPKPFEGKTKSARQGQFKHHLERVSRAVGGSVVSEPQADGCFSLNPPGSVGPGAPLAPKLTPRPRRAVKAGEQP